MAAAYVPLPAHPEGLNAPPIVTLEIRHTERWWIVTSPQMPGMYIATPHGLSYALADVERTWEALLLLQPAEFQPPKPPATLLPSTVDNARLVTVSLYAKVRDLLDSYAVPCPDKCEHAHCPILRELHGIVENSRSEIANAQMGPPKMATPPHLKCDRCGDLSASGKVGYRCTVSGCGGLYDGAA